MGSVSLDDVLNSLEETIIVVNKKLKVLYVNRAGEELLGRSSKDLVGINIANLTGKKTFINELTLKAVLEGRSFRGKSAKLKLEETMNVDFSLSPLFRSDLVDGAVLVVSENIIVTDREESEFDAALSLLGTISHEIKNPLGGIKGAAQLLKKALDNSSYNEYIELIVKETDRLNSVLQDYLTVYKKPSFVPTNVHEVIEKSLSVMSAELAKKSLTVKRFYDPSLPYVNGDSGKLLQVFLNILKNAIEALKKGGGIEISTHPSKELYGQQGYSSRMAVITFKDNGKGMAEDDLHKIFLPFFSKKKKGSGIGLAISKKIVKDHRGLIKVKSEKNKGSEFSVYLPFTRHE